MFQLFFRLLTRLTLGIIDSKTKISCFCCTKKDDANQHDPISNDFRQLDFYLEIFYWSLLFYGGERYLVLNLKELFKSNFSAILYLIIVVKLVFIVTMSVTTITFTK